MVVVIRDSAATAPGIELTEAGAQRTNRPLVSVLTTSYNHDRWLLDTLHSVDRQVYPEVEHIVVDDGSTDRSTDVLAAWPGSRLRWSATPNQGQARALNEALRMSSGEIIGWLSSDDAYYSLTVVRDVVAAFAKHPEAALVYGHAVLIDENGLQLQAEWVPPVSLFGWRPPMHILQPAAFVRRSALGSRIVDESFDVAMDTELWLRLRGPGRWVRLDQVLAAERHHPARKSHTMKAILRDELARLDVAYQPAGGATSNLRGRWWSVAFRLAGLALLSSLERRPDGFEGDLDSRMALIRRQVSVPRSRMGTGSKG